MDYIKLNNNLIIPQLGIGTYKVIEEKDINTLLESAIKNNYTMIDTASFYENELLIGNYFKNNPSLKKDLVFSTKVWPTDFEPDDTKRSIERSLDSLSLDKIDIMFLHWPSEGFLDSWKVLENYYEQGVFNSIAVCNFHQKHIEKLLANANIPPVMDQLETHPLLTQEEMMNFLEKYDIKLEAWAPLAKANKELFSSDTLKNLANKYNKTIGQIILRWHLENNRIIIPKSVNPKRIKENINIFDFSIEKEDIILIDKLNKNKRVSKDPDNEDWLTEIRTGAKN
ncbi:aldo/keto reductase [Miniphocaeibacter massiliensis]|uniref:aldo/keto reductase n=1 Tax=Miniphocaeibacter massiliensis TaxID=2041841 RepID=UPI000C068E1F|nr:aldo/keto reductase [Miniphocaeibacter massiliensis]